MCKNTFHILLLKLHVTEVNAFDENELYVLFLKPDNTDRQLFQDRVRMKIGF